MWARLIGRAGERFAGYAIVVIVQPVPVFGRAAFGQKERICIIPGRKIAAVSVNERGRTG
jgi:hypothetical protein